MPLIHYQLEGAHNSSCPDNRKPGCPAFLCPRLITIAVSPEFVTFGHFSRERRNVIPDLSTIRHWQIVNSPAQDFQVGLRGKPFQGQTFDPCHKSSSGPTEAAAVAAASSFNGSP